MTPISALGATTFVFLCVVAVIVAADVLLRVAAWVYDAIAAAVRWWWRL